MEWSRSEALALANESCTHCQGYGLRRTGKEESQPCNCVLRGIFKVCFARFRYCARKEKHMSRVSLEQVGGKNRRQVWGRKDEEYLADFCIVAKRILTEEEHKLFRVHFLLGADWKLCCRQYKMDRGTFFHAIYRIKQKLGRAFRELEPYSLFPLDEYFGGAVRKELKPETRNVLMMPMRSEQRLRPPLRKVA